MVVYTLKGRILEVIYVYSDAGMLIFTCTCSDSDLM